MLEAGTRRIATVGLVGVLALIPGTVRAGDGTTPEDDGVRKRTVHRIVFADGEGAMHGIGADFALPFLGGGFLGVELTALTPELRAHFGVPEDAGVMVARVSEDSPAWRAGLRVGDIVTGVAGTAVETPTDLAREVRSRGGETAVLDLWREGELEQVEVTFEEREALGKGLGALPFACGDEADCAFDRIVRLHRADCGGDECRVEVRCEGADDCECTVDGEPRDCDELP